MEHFKMVCKICNKVISQCRCMDCNKTIKYGVCMTCSDKEMDKVKSEPMNRKESIEIAERELGETKPYQTKAKAITLLADKIKKINGLNLELEVQWYANKSIVERLNEKVEGYEYEVERNTELQQKLDRAERALLIESSEPEERSQEASHYNWLDDKNKELQQKLDRMEKELVEEKYLNDMASQAKTMT